MRHPPGSENVKMVPLINCPRKLSLAPVPIKDQSRWVLNAVVTLVLSWTCATAFGQGTSPQRRDSNKDEGTVLESAGGPNAQGGRFLAGGKTSTYYEMKKHTARRLLNSGDRLLDFSP